MSNWVSLFYILFLLIFGDIADILHLLFGVIRRLSVSASFASASFDSLFEITRLFHFLTTSSIDTAS